MYVHIGTGNRESGKVKVNTPSSVENKAKSHEEQEETKKVVTKIVKAEKYKSSEIDPPKPELKVPKIPKLKRLLGDFYSEIEA